MIVATAGHVDHGKTCLVEALTGVDTDRLPEEKRRGLTIDLGFAHHDFGDGVAVSFIDVPGHKRFIHNMLAGVAGVDLALLVIAADDGVMPQTREHLAILELVGVSGGLVALSKIDRVDARRCSAVIAEIETLLTGTVLDSAEILPVSAQTGHGIEALAERLRTRASQTARRSAAGHFRLAIDRAFSVQGAGIVVTGTVFSGQVAVGDQLVLSPRGAPVRVRGLQTREADAPHASAGDRCALNLAGAGLELADVHRGDWIQATALHGPTSRLDARLQVLAVEPAALAHWTPVHVHIGAARRTGRIALLEDRTLGPGTNGLAQIVLDEPVCAVAGDRYIVRDQSAQRTVGGGRIIFPYSPARGRARPERLAEVRAMEARTPAAALEARASVSSRGVALEEFLRGFNVTPGEAETMLAATNLVVSGNGASRVCLSAERWHTLRADVADAVDAHHAARPNALGLDEAALARTLGGRVDAVVASAVVASLIGSGDLGKTGTVVHRPGRTTAPSPEDDRLWKTVRPIMIEAGLKPPVVRDLADRIGMRHTDLDKFLTRMTRHGRTVKVAANRYFSTEAVVALGEIAGALAEKTGDGGFTAKEFRDASGIGRNLTIELLEFFDQSGLTRRVGDKRRLIRSVDEVFALS